MHRFIQYRKEQGKSPYTVNGEVAHVTHMFTWAYKLKLVHHHPVKGVGYRKTPIKEWYLSHEEIDRLLETCQGDLRDMLILALGTGMRASEVLGLDREQIDVKNTVMKLKDSKKSERRTIPLPVQDVPRQVPQQTKQTG